MHLKYIISEPYTGKTVKHVLKSALMLSEKLIKKLKYSNKILLNSLPVYVNHPVESNDILEVFIDFIEDNSNIIPEPIDLDILFEDSLLIAINKAPGLVVHPTGSHPSGTIANGLTYYFGNKGIQLKVRPVSRLDRDTSGIILFALNPHVQESLIRQMKDKSMVKEYTGIVHGVPSKKSSTIDYPIDRAPGSIMLREVTETGYPSVTHYEVIEELDGYSLLRFRLETGRTHQIRVHCKAIGHPLLGDTLYGPSCVTELLQRQALHSNRLVFLHPGTFEKIELTALLPQDMKHALEILRK